ncbi:SURF1 family cytochrome oxidase biogenesis protein [Falsirhodobacter algicola]|uniref:SURF1-like protein n=1 Tax=Falsirhodobacter algicola TaxID=2692330 RepID=A0A8J8MR35_9RHOB|nr:SURF1 family cytochrome oxidase biogenesis protein [Falsirhodobacter algicola]QUS35131.1 SURF1 family protein [Falsirhodobacter algicola]
MRRWTVLLGGLALLCLFAGAWQVREDQAERARLALAAARAGDIPDALPDAPEPKRDLYRRVRVQGVLAGDAAYVAVDHPTMGPGFRVIQPLEVEGRRLLLDRGFIYAAWRGDPLVATRVEVNGRLDWPSGIGALANRAGAAPVMIVADTPTGDGIIPMPLDPSVGAGRHGRLALAIFALALVLAGMTVLAQWRIKRHDGGHLTQ